jgi:hypothetical protein
VEKLLVNSEKRHPFKGTLMFTERKAEHLEKKAFSGPPYVLLIGGISEP